MIEHELGRVQQRPDEVFIRFGSGGWDGELNLHAVKLLGGGAASEAADKEFFDDGVGCRLRFDMGWERAVGR